MHVTHTQAHTHIQVFYEYKHKWRQIKAQLEEENIEEIVDRRKLEEG